MPKAWTITICLVSDGHFKFPTQNIFLSIITLFARIISANSVRIKINEFSSLPKLHGFLFNVAIFRQPLHLKSFRTSHFLQNLWKSFSLLSLKFSTFAFFNRSSLLRLNPYIMFSTHFWQQENSIYSSFPVDKIVPFCVGYVCTHI